MGRVSNPKIYGGSPDYKTISDTNKIKTKKKGRRKK